MDKYRYLVVGGRINQLPGYQEIYRRYEDSVYVNDYGYHEIGSEEVFTNEKEAKAHNSQLSMEVSEFKKMIVKSLKHFTKHHLKKHRNYSLEIRFINFEKPTENQNIKFGDCIILVIRSADPNLELEIEKFLGGERGYMNLGYEDGQYNGMLYMRAKNKSEREEKIRELLIHFKKPTH